MSEAEGRREVIHLSSDSMDAFIQHEEVEVVQRRRTGFAAGVPNPTTNTARAAAAGAQLGSSFNYPGDGNVDHILALNIMSFSDVVETKDPGTTGTQAKSEQQLLEEAARRLLESARPPPAGNEEAMALLRKPPCKLANCSKDSKGQYQYTFRIPHLADVRPSGLRIRPWHLTWIGTYGMAPLGLTYSHLCPFSDCVEPSHGVWESDIVNKSRNYCKAAAQVILPNGKMITICPHVPRCVNPLIIVNWDDPRVSQL